MEEEAGMIIEKEERIGKEEVFTKIVRAGKRTYFFDVKATRKDDYYLTITESKKRMGKEGKVFYEKHKIFLYKEDFDKFSDGLKDAVDFIDKGIDIIQAAPEKQSEQEPVTMNGELSTREFSNIDFDDLGKE